MAGAFASGWQPDDFVLAPEIYGEHRETMFRENRYGIIVMDIFFTGESALRSDSSYGL